MSRGIKEGGEDRKGRRKTWIGRKCSYLKIRAGGLKSLERSDRTETVQGRRQSKEESVRGRVGRYD